MIRWGLWWRPHVEFWFAGQEPTDWWAPGASLSEGQVLPLTPAFGWSSLGKIRSKTVPEHSLIKLHGMKDNKRGPPEPHDLSCARPTQGLDLLSQTRPLLSRTTALGSPVSSMAEEHLGKLLTFPTLSCLGHQTSNSSSLLSFIPEGGTSVKGKL